ncbi:MAG: pilus assembly protein PilP [Gammaproteobacteria bacterium]|jgi:type IV pilus assembly protein PilP|nr:pilus assembly protein PilP [Gammaproteobacteria bacterium]
MLKNNFFTIRVSSFVIRKLVGRAILACLLSSFLVGCGGKDNSSDLKSFIAELKKKSGAPEDLAKKFPMRKEVNPPTAPLSSPFPQQGPGKNTGSLSKPPLERYPTDALHLLGTIQEGSEKFAVISAPDGLIYQVSLGTKLGDQNGVITNIDENQITVNEPADVAAGILAARTINLQTKG